MMIGTEDDTIAGIVRTLFTLAANMRCLKQSWDAYVTYSAVSLISLKHFKIKLGLVGPCFGSCVSGLCFVLKLEWGVLS